MSIRGLPADIPNESAFITALPLGAGARSGFHRAGLDGGRLRG